MKERITKRHGQIVQTLSTPFFFGNSKLLQPVLINKIDNDSQLKPVLFLQGLTMVTWRSSIPAWSHRSVLFSGGSVHRNSKLSFVWRLSNIQQKRSCHELNNPALSRYKSNNTWPWHQRVSVFLKSALHVSWRTTRLFKTRPLKVV